MNRQPKNDNRRLQTVRGHAPLANFYILYLQRCDFLHSGTKIIAFRPLDLLDKNNKRNQLRSLLSSKVEQENIEINRYLLFKSCYTVLIFQQYNQSFIAY